MTGITSHKKSGFLDLPAELRNHIYELAVADHPFTSKQPGITRCCRQARQESLSIYYSQDFEVLIPEYDSPRSPRYTLSLRTHNPEMLQLVKSLTVVTYMPRGTTMDKAVHFIRAAHLQAGFQECGLSSSPLCPGWDRVARVYQPGPTMAV